MRKILMTILSTGALITPTINAITPGCTTACSINASDEKPVTIHNGTLRRENGDFILEEKDQRYVLEVPEHIQAVSLLAVNKEVEVKGVLQDHTVMDMNVLKVKNLAEKHAR